MEGDLKSYVLSSQPPLKELKGVYKEVFQNSLEVVLGLNIGCCGNYLVMVKKNGH